MDQLHQLCSAGFCGPAVLLIETVLQFGQVTRHPAQRITVLVSACQAGTVDSAHSSFFWHSYEN